jgi:hypothetical protein
MRRPKLQDDNNEKGEEKMKNIDNDMPLVVLQT